MQTSNWCFGPKHLGLRTSCAPFLRDCEAVTCTNKHSCRGSLFVTQMSLQTQLDLRLRMRRVWRDITDMNPLESDDRLVTFHSRFSCPLLDLRAGSCTFALSGVPPQCHLAFCALTTLSMLSLCRGHANLLCIIPISTCPEG